MDVTIYVPDDLKPAIEELRNERGLLSRLFREALTDELERRKAVAEALSEARTLELALEDSDGRAYFGRIEASEIAFDDHAEITVYLTVDERVIVYDPGKLAYWESDNPESDLDFLSQDAYVDAMNALGLKPVIDL